MTWFILALISVFCLATAELTQQHILNNKNPFTPRTSLFITFLFQSILTIPFILFSPLRTELFTIFQQSIIINILVVTILSSFGNFFYFKSFQVKNISLSTILTASSVVVSTFLGIVFFNESTNLLKFLGVLLVLIAIVSLNYKNNVLEKNHFFGLLAGLTFGMTYSLDKSIVTSINPVIYLFWTFLLIAIFVFLFNPKEVIGSVKGKPFSAFKVVLFSGIGYLFYNLLTFFAYTLGGEVGRIDAINNSQVFLIILFEYFILKHKSSLVRKIITALIAFSGVVILGYF